MIGQIISDIETANWAIAISVTVVGVLLTIILNRLLKTQDKHGDRITEVERDVAVLFDRDK